ncbi:MAG: hydrolase [Clostridiaceae bacterium]|nr:hydrolase [Clostridiaceae bacterium]
MINKVDSKFFLKREDAILLIIDIQEKLAPAMTDPIRTADQTAALLQGSVLMGLPVMVTEQYPRGLGRTVEQIRQHLPADVVISEKISFNACTDEIRQALISSGRKQVVIAGMETHVCVYQTVRCLLNEGYDVCLAADAISSRRQDNRENAIESMRQMGAVISNTETILFDLLQEAGTPLFKQVSALIK